MLLNLLIILIGMFGSRIPDGKIDSYLKSQLKNYNRFEYKIVSMPRIIESQRVKVELAKDKELKINGSMAYIPVYVSKGKTRTQSFISLKIKLYDNVLIANRTIKRGEKLSPSDFSIKEIDVSELRSKAVKTGTDLENYTAKRNIKKNKVLTEILITRKTLIERNRIVKAVKRVGNIEISFNVKTRSAGNKDDLIKVYDYKNGNQFVAKVVNKNLVQIEE